MSLVYGCHRTALASLNIPFSLHFQQKPPGCVLSLLMAATDTHRRPASCTEKKPNREMATCLRKLAEEVLKDGTDAKAGFKANAWRKAASSIEGQKDKLTSAKEALKLPGVGKGTASLIEEFLETGMMGEREKAARAEAEETKASPGEKASPGKKGKEAAKANKSALAFL